VRALPGLLRLARPPVGRLALSVVLGAVAVLTGVGLMTLAGYLISRCAEHPPVLSLTVAIVGVRAFGITRPLARYGERLVSHDAALRVLARTRAVVVGLLAGQLPDRAGRHRHGDLMARLVGDVDATQDLFLRGLHPPLVALVSGAVSVAVARVLLPEAGVILAIGLVVGGVLVPGLAVLFGRATGRRLASARAELTAELIELIAGAPELVVLGADRAAEARVERLDAELRGLGRRQALAGGAVEGLSILVTGGTAITVLAACAHAAMAGRLDRVLIAAVTLLALAAFEAVAPLPSAALTLRSALESARRLLEVVEQPPPVRDPVAAVAPAAGTGTLAMEQVRLEPGDVGSWGLRGVDLVLAPGERVALVGPSGSGKSTIAELLVRFADPDGGRVTLADTDVRDLQQQDLRRRVTLDGQDAHLFSTSVRENIRLARPDADDTQIEAALHRARLEDWIAGLPDGLDTLVGEDGAAVSGGERRRLALARAFLANADVLVLDEPTAHLDAATAAAVIGDVMSPAGGRTVLLITHQGDEASCADRVLRLRHGRLVPEVSPEVVPELIPGG
jgi:thiol reductant ABC exporter CydC subunit